MRSLGEAFAASIARRGATTALVCDDVDWSFEALGARATAIAGGLAERGVRPGDRVAVGLPNSADLVAAVLGVIQAGTVLVPLNPAYTADELVYIVRDAGVRVAIVTAEHAAILMNEDLPELAVIFSSLDLLHASSLALPAVESDAAALIVYTSGTTGRPKGAVLSHSALLSNFNTVARAWDWTENDRLLLTLPCFHLHGLGLGIITSLLIGSSVVLRRRFVVDDVCGDLERSGATMFFGVPTMYNRLVGLPAEVVETHDLSRMRLWVSGSAPLTAATFERFERAFGFQLMDRYGMTECGFVLATPYDQPRRAGVVGVPLAGISVLLIDSDAADAGHFVEVPQGAQGEIAIRGPNLFSGYWRRPEDTQRVFIDGYFRSGDLAVREPDGKFRIVGRSSVDIIKTRGFKVSAVEIEDCLQHHPEVQEVAVVGLPDADQGERVVAAVTAKPDSSLTSETLNVFARAHLAPHKIPAEFVFIDDIPRTGPGKFKKKELIRLLAPRT